MPKKLRIRGVVTSGMGRGSYYVSLPQYRKFFESLLGQRVFEGTLNIKLRNARWYNIGLERNKYSPPDGHGAIYYALAFFRGERILLIRPARSVHGDDVVEIVARSNLRAKYSLKDGETITIELEAEK